MRSHFFLALSLMAAVILTPVLKGELLTVGSASVGVGSTFSVPVTISGTSDLYAFQFDLSFDPSILQLQSVAEGPFLPSAGATFFIPATIDNVLGVASFTADSLLGPGPGAAGAGILASFNFQAFAGGTSTLSLANVILLDSNLNDIQFETTGGGVIVTSVPEPASAWLIVAALVGLRLRRSDNEPRGS
ncbi:MAG: cohesin domain-containing protein [Acidobacteriia bacterium]|nr:cohesin domain-containing protein [Terriglobia bacterium]